LRRRAPAASVSSSGSVGANGPPDDCVAVKRFVADAKRFVADARLRRIVG
jgi:hypothetical protein